MGMEWTLILISVVVALLGIYIAYVFYLKRPGIPHSIVRRIPGVYKLLYNKYYVDEAYNAVIVNPLVKGSEIIYENFDLAVIDGALNGSASATGFFGRALSALQTGYVKDYVLVFLLGAVIIVGILLF
jgi:NADH-quinone oxidoreductase subunit L